MKDLFLYITNNSNTSKLHHHTFQNKPRTNDLLKIIPGHGCARQSRTFSPPTEPEISADEVAQLWKVLSPG